MKPEELKDLIKTLRGGRQCDEDGTEIIMSRQACVEAANLLEKQLLTDSMKNEITHRNFVYIRLEQQSCDGCAFRKLSLCALQKESGATRACWEGEAEGTYAEVGYIWVKKE